MAHKPQGLLLVMVIMNLNKQSLSSVGAAFNLLDSRADGNALEYR